jgi:hypothetical protein
VGNTETFQPSLLPTELKNQERLQSN